MAHGYLGDGYGTHGEFDPDREDDRDREWRGLKRRMMFSGPDRGGMDDDRWSERRPRRERFVGDYSEGRRSFSANPDDHYRNWRDRHMSELDRDYADFCREREQQFHREFDDWRDQRRGNPQPLQTGMTQTGISHDPTGELELTNTAIAGQAETDPMADATLGTTSGRKRR
jgi:hypothetical protein